LVPDEASAQRIRAGGIGKGGGVRFCALPLGTSAFALSAFAALVGPVAPLFGAVMVGSAAASLGAAGGQCLANELPEPNANKRRQSSSNSFGFSGVP